MAKNAIYMNCRLWACSRPPTRTRRSSGTCRPSTAAAASATMTFARRRRSTATRTIPRSTTTARSCSSTTAASAAASSGNPHQYHSRAVEYKIDEASKTATLAWEFPGAFTVPDAWYTTNWYIPFWGDADRLANGNELVAAGTGAPPRREPGLRGRPRATARWSGSSAPARLRRLPLGTNHAAAHPRDHALGRARRTVTRSASAPSR